MQNLLNTLNNINWISLVFSLLIIPTGFSLLKILWRWINNNRPSLLLLNHIHKNDEPCIIFVRDMYKDPKAELRVTEPRVGPGTIPHVRKLYAEVEGKGIAYIYNVLGKVGKTKNIRLLGLGDDNSGEWNSNVILLGAQSQKHFDFFSLMKNVAYRVDNKSIYRNLDNKVIIQEPDCGYGIILKTENTLYKGKRGGNAFLIGGNSTFGTLIAAYYFKENFKELGKKFGKNCFGIVVKASLSAGEEAVERIKEYDVVFSTTEKIKEFLKKRIKYLKMNKRSRLSQAELQDEVAATSTNYSEPQILTTQFSTSTSLHTKVDDVSASGIKLDNSFATEANEIRNILTEEKTDFNENLGGTAIIRNKK